MNIILGSRRHHYVKGVVVFVLVVALAAGTMGCSPDADPTPPYDPEIRDWHDLHAIRYHPGQTYILMNDLDATTAGYGELASATANGGKGWEPIKPFTGSLDGQGYEIGDPFIRRPDEDGVALFGAVGEGGLVENLGVVNAHVTGGKLVGGLVGYISHGIVSNSNSSGSVTGTSNVGGLVGYNSGTVDSSYSTCSVSGDWRVAGLVGCNWQGTVSNSYFSGSVSGRDDVGGLLGWNVRGSTVANSYATGGVTGSSGVGGVVGYNSGTVDSSYSTCSVSGDWRVAGLVGRNHGTVSNSFWDIETSGQATSDAGMGRTTAAMMDISTFVETETEGLDEPWDMIAVDSGVTNAACTWNIVPGQTYPFLSWQSLV